MRVRTSITQDRVMLIAAGATFYLLLALVPALTAFVSIYGVAADPATIAEHVDFLAGILPAGGVELINTQLNRLIEQDSGALSLGVIFGFLVALWSANGAVKTLFEAMNVAYGETEKRSFIRLNLITLGVTLGAMVMAALLIAAIGIVPAIIAFAGLPPVTETLLSVLRWPVLIILVGLAVSLLYRYGPSRNRAKWRWITWGSALATVVWVIASLAFSFYLANFANYEATYGALGAVIGFMLWTWVSMVVIILGAELDAEIEHQTAQDSTVGTPKPMGERGAYMADTLGQTVDQLKAKARKPERSPKEEMTTH